VASLRGVTPFTQARAMSSFASLALVIYLSILKLNPQSALWHNTCNSSYGRILFVDMVSHIPLLLIMEGNSLARPDWLLWWYQNQA